MKSSLSTTFAFGIAALAANHASAVGSPLGPTHGFDVFVKGDAWFLGGDTEGTVAAGGNVTVNNGFAFGNHTIGSYFAPGDSIATALVVGKQLNLDGGAHSKGFVKIGDTSNGIFLNDLENGNPNKLRVSKSPNYGSGPFLEVQDNNQSAASASAASGIDFDAAFGQLGYFSAVMKGLTATHSFLDLDSANGSIDGKIQFDFGSNSGQSVLKLTASEFGSVGEFNILGSAGLGDSLVIDVDLGGASLFNFTSKFAGNLNPNASSILWNFTNGDGLAIYGDSFYGTIFAPTIDLKKMVSNNLVGSIVANSYYHSSGEVHLGSFNGDIPPPSNVPDAASTLVLLGVSLPALILIRRRAR